MAQVRPDSRIMSKKMMEVVDTGIIPEAWESTISQSTEVRLMIESGTPCQRFNEDLYTVLVDKAEGEAMVRIKSHNSGEGMAAYMAVYKWYTSTSGQGVTNRMSKAMNPTPPKSDADLANALEKWEENIKQLEAMC